MNKISNSLKGSLFFSRIREPGGWRDVIAAKEKSEAVTPPPKGAHQGAKEQ